MKKLLAFTVLLLVWSGPAHAAGEMKVGFFNMAVVAAKCDAYKENQARIQSKFSREQSTLKHQEKELQKRYAEFKNSASKLTPEQRSNMNLELMYSSRTFDDKNSAFKRRRSAEETQARNEVTRVVTLAVAELGRRKKFTMIMEANSAGAFFVDKSVDVTAEVLQEANRIWREKPRALTDNSPLPSPTGLR